MNVHRIIGVAAVLAVLAAAGAASAQVAAPGGSGAVNVMTTPSTVAVTPGATSANFGTIQISGNGGGTYSIASLPVTVTPGSGASTSALSNCQLMNGSQSLTSGANVINNLQSGSNTFTFDTPLSVGSATTTLTIDCNVASSATSGSTFQFVAGMPTLSPGLGVMLNAIPSVRAGTQNGVLAIVTLDGTRSGANVSVSSIPVTLSFSGASADQFTNCALRSANSLGTALNTGANALATLNGSGGANTITLDTPLMVPANSGIVLALTCNVASSAPVGGSATVSIDPTAVHAANQVTGGPITPATASGANGTAPTSGTITITPAGTGTGGTTPGVPNTGAGGEAAANILLLIATGSALLFGARVALRRR